MSKTVIFFGAGASFGCGIKNPPPLGDNLFDMLKNDFPNTWGTLEKELSKKFEADFENGMQDFIKRDKKLYFQKDLARFFYKYNPSYKDKDCYSRLINKIKEKKAYGDISFITLNYDVLLEKTMKNKCIIPNTSYPYKYFKETHKIFNDKIEVCHPHGVCNIFSRLSMSQNVEYDADMFATHQNIVPQDVYLASNKKEFYNFVNDKAGNPMMCYYTKGKPHPLFKWNYLDIEKIRYKELILNAEKIIIIGVKYNEDDNHIWDPLRETNADVYYYDPSEAEILNSLSLPNFTIIKKNFEEALPDIMKSIK